MKRSSVYEEISAKRRNEARLKRARTSCVTSARPRVRVAPKYRMINGDAGGDHDHEAGTSQGEGECHEEDDADVAEVEGQARIEAHLGRPQECREEVDEDHLGFPDAGCDGQGGGDESHRQDRDHQAEADEQVDLWSLRHVL